MSADGSRGRPGPAHPAVSTSTTDVTPASIQTCRMTVGWTSTPPAQGPVRRSSVAGPGVLPPTTHRRPDDRSDAPPPLSPTGRALYPGGDYRESASSLLTYSALLARMRDRAATSSPFAVPSTPLFPVSTPHSYRQQHPSLAERRPCLLSPATFPSAGRALSYMLPTDPTSPDVLSSYAALRHQFTSAYRLPIVNYPPPPWHHAAQGIVVGLPSQPGFLATPPGSAGPPATALPFEFVWPRALGHGEGRRLSASEMSAERERVTWTLTSSSASAAGSPSYVSRSSRGWPTATAPPPPRHLHPHPHRQAAAAAASAAAVTPSSSSVDIQAVGSPSLPTAVETGQHQQPHYPVHFMSGSIIDLGDGRLKRIDDLSTDDFIRCAEISSDLRLDAITVVHMLQNHERNTVLLGFSVGQYQQQQQHQQHTQLQVTVEATLEHPFFVYNQGWSSYNPQRTMRRYGLSCHQLTVGDCCISLTQRPGASVTTSASLSVAEAPDAAAGLSVGTRLNVTERRAQQHSVLSHHTEQRTGRRRRRRQLEDVSTESFPVPVDFSSSRPSPVEGVRPVALLQAGGESGSATVECEPSHALAAGRRRKRRWSAPDTVDPSLTTSGSDVVQSTAASTSSGDDPSVVRRSSWDRLQLN